MRDRPSLTVTTTSGRIVITGEDRLDIVVDGDAAIEDGDDGGVIVRGSSSSLEVQSISGSVTVTLLEDAQPRFRLRSVSGHVRCDCEQGEDADISIATTSGSISVAPD